jgi:hypothetical protein
LVLLQRLASASQLGFGDIPGPSPFPEAGSQLALAQLQAGPPFLLGLLALAPGLPFRHQRRDGFCQPPLLLAQGLQLAG